MGETFIKIKIYYERIINWINKVLSKVIGGIVFFILVIGIISQLDGPLLKPYLIELIILSLSFGTFLMIFFPILNKFKKNKKKIETISYFLYSGMYFVIGLLCEPFITKFEVTPDLTLLTRIVINAGSIIGQISIFLGVLGFVAGISRLFKISSRISTRITDMEEADQKKK